MDRDSAEKEVARRIARANDDLRAELDVDEGKFTQFMTLSRLVCRSLRPLDGSAAALVMREVTFATGEDVLFVFRCFGSGGCL